MTLHIQTSEPLNFGSNSRLVFTLSPGILVRIGPDIDTALKNVISNLMTVVERSGMRPCHFATTYSLRTLVIIINCFETEEEVQFLLFRLYFRSGQFTIYEFDDQKLSQRIIDQLQAIQKHQPKLPKPFHCVEDWYGAGPIDHPIYDRMVKASTSTDTWQKFKTSVYTPASSH